MRLFGYAMVAVLGIAMFAVAALVWDRRRELPAILATRRAAAGQSAGADEEAEDPVGEQPGGVATVAATDRRYLPHAVVAGLLFVGMFMLIASCAGALSF